MSGMRVLLTGHAGLYVRSGGSSLLCDPWFSPAYFGSWFPFPDNGDLDIGAISSPDYLYISHLHKDHYDARFLQEHVDKSATVLLPDFPIPDLRAALEGLGFDRFVQTRSGQPLELDGFRVCIATSASVSDGPIGDSVLAVDDGESRILDQNDCHPREVSVLTALAPYDVHFLQYSGAIWYPMVYRLDAATKNELSRQKRLRQLSRALRYIETVEARHVVPFAGPPAFLDDDLFELNDFDDDPSNIFQDQQSFLRALGRHGVTNGKLAVAGTELDLGGGDLAVSHSKDPEDLRAAFEDKRAYLGRYRERRREEIEESCPRGAGDRDPDKVVEAMAGWIEPLLAEAPAVREALGGPIVLDVDRYGVLIDPATGTVRRWTQDDWEHYFRFDEALLDSLVDRRVDDWVNELFLSCRFEASRVGDYNETVFAFFKCLSPPRMAYLEASLSLGGQTPTAKAGAQQPTELWRCGDFLVQRHCPHLGGDLSRFGEVEGGVLTCTLHGRQFELASGRCLNAEGLDLFTMPAERFETGGCAEA